MKDSHNKRNGKKYPFICWIMSSKQFWIRIFGYGLSGKNTKYIPLLFSERMGFRKYLRIGSWVFKTLSR